MTFETSLQFLNFVGFLILLLCTTSLLLCGKPGTSLKFAIQLGEQLFGKEAADKIAEQMLVER